MSEQDEFVAVEAMALVGGDLSLDLVNTASGRIRGPLRDKLRSYDDVVTWAERAELLGSRRAARLRRAAAADPGEASAVLERVRSLREVIYRVFTADPARPPDLRALGEAAAEAASERRLERTDDGYVFAWTDSDRLDQIIWPVALSAAELLASRDRARVKECAADDCSWLFMDRSRNRSRRWCDMRDCGNRAKARRFQARQRRAER